MAPGWRSSPTRTGGGDIYILTLASGDLKRLTFDDGLDQLDAWSRDGKWIYFSNNGHDVGGKNDIYRVSAEGGTPMPVSADRFTNEFFKPRRRRMARSDRVRRAGQRRFAMVAARPQLTWTNSEIWLRKDGSPAVYEKLVDLNGRKACGPSGRRMASSSTSCPTVAARRISGRCRCGGKLRQVTKFTDGRVLWPSIGYDGKAMVFERDFKIWQLDTKTGEKPSQCRSRWWARPRRRRSSTSLINQFSDLAVSADNRKMALVAHGEVFASSAATAAGVSRDPNAGPESQVAWAPDSMRLAYVSQRDALTHVYLYDFAKHSETQLTSDPLPDQAPVCSPDGKTLAFVRGRKELRATPRRSRSGCWPRDSSAADRPAAVAWAPDNRGSPTPAMPNADCGTYSWSPPAGGRAAPGQLPGEWRSSGRSSGVRMASSLSSRPRSARKTR